MAHATADDGVRLYYEDDGAGRPILFIHEFAGDSRGWEPQLRFFSRRHRCIIYNARGYPPSDVPTDQGAYSQAQAVRDAVAVLDAAGVERAHVIGHSMGGFCALHLVLQNPERLESAVVTGCGYGAEPEHEGSFRAECEVIADAFAAEGAAAVAERYAVGPARVQFQSKDPKGWRRFKEILASLSSDGAARTMRGVQARRPSLYALRDQLARIQTPVLIVVGDEDEGCLEPSLMLKRTIPSAALAMLPRTGHTSNLEEPERFNQLVADFISTVEAGRWTFRDPRSQASSVTGMDER